MSETWEFIGWIHQGAVLGFAFRECSTQTEHFRPVTPEVIVQFLGDGTIPEEGRPLWRQALATYPAPARRPA